MSLARTLASLLVLSAASVGLVACTGRAPAPSPKPTVRSDAPAAGQCWNATVADAGAWSDWKGSGAVPCSASHTLYTFAVARIPGLMPPDWAKSSTDGSTADSVAAAAFAACRPAYKTLGLAWNQQLVPNYYFIPSHAEWKKGERWVRCDIGLLDYGTPLAAESFVPLPSIKSLTSAVAQDPKRFALCVDTPTAQKNIGPFPDKGDVITDCRANPQWSLVLEGAFTGGAKAPYPSAHSYDAQMSAACSAVAGPNVITRGFGPPKSGWQQGQREIDCWISPKNWAATPGTST
jgi:hypothetical protein